MATVRTTLGALAILLAICGVTLTFAQTTAKLTGTVTYRDWSLLPPNAVLRVQLVEIGPADAPSKTIAEQTQNVGGKAPPYAFEVTYDPAQINQARTYAVQARITTGNQLIYTTTQQYAVITQNRPTNVDIVVTRVGLPNTSNGNWLLLAAAVLAGLTLAVSLVRRRALGDEGR
jgi:putative lipoprotein